MPRSLRRVVGDMRHRAAPLEPTPRRSTATTWHHISSRRAAGVTVTALMAIGVVLGPAMAVEPLTAQTRTSGTTYGAAATHGTGTTRAPGTAAATSQRRQSVELTADSTRAPGYAGDGVPGYGDAANLGGISDITMNAPATALAADPAGGGYWVAAADGGVFAFGNAGYYGSMGGRPLYAPIVGMAATPDGQGYWLVAADGGIFAFGNAAFYGSMGGHPLAQPVVGMAATPDGQGYWLVAADGGIFAFGNAPFLGSAANDPINTWVAGMAATPDGQGYWLVAATAGVLPFGNAQFYGPTPNDPPFSPTTAIAATPDGKGYWLLQPDDGPIAFAPASAVPPITDGPQTVAVAASQVGPDPDDSAGAFCNPYGPCEPWCVLFATWVWQHAGLAVPTMAFEGHLYDWAAANATVLSPNQTPAPGDGVLYGTGPSNTTTSPHMGIVAQVWPDGAIVTVEGDAGPQPTGQFGVVVNGPFLPADADHFPPVEFPIYAFVQP